MIARSERSVPARAQRPYLFDGLFLVFPINQGLAGVRRIPLDIFGDSLRVTYLRVEASKSLFEIRQKT